MAGAGVSVSLLAAVAAIVALVAGVLGFNAWPSAAQSGADGALSVPRAAVRAAAIRPLVLPAPAGSARAGRTARLVPAGRPGGRAAPDRPATPADRGSSTTPTPALTPPARTPGGPLAPAGKAVASGTDTAADTLGSAGGKVAPAAPVLTTVAGTVAGTGQAVAGVVSGLGPQ